jgi:uncharacterized protein (DUF1499 family)
VSGRRKSLMVVGGVVGLGLACAAWINRRLFTVNDVTTGASTAYPRLTPRVYYAGADDIVATTRTAIEALPRWRVVHSDPEKRTVDAEVETPVGGFLDDVTVLVEQVDADRARVIIRSRSRQGKGDLGQNAVHIRELQTEMDRRLMTGAAI